MARKSGFACTYCGYIAYVGRFPHECPHCHKAYESSDPKFFSEPYPEIDPDFLAKQAEEAKAKEEPKPAEPVKEPEPSPAEEEETQEKYCPSCGIAYPLSVRRCEKCHRAMILRPKVGAKKEAAPTPKKKERRFRLVGAGLDLTLTATEEKQVLGRKSHQGMPATVSGRHLLYYVKDGALVIEDNESTNGTYVDNVKINVHVPIKLDFAKGFVSLSLGKSAKFRLTLCD